MPQVLLDFAKEINAKLGPMEEQRLKYGPDLYRVCGVGNEVVVTCAVWADNAAELSEQHDQEVREGGRRCNGRSARGLCQRASSRRA